MGEMFEIPKTKTKIKTIYAYENKMHEFLYKLTKLKRFEPRKELHVTVSPSNP